MKFFLPILSLALVTLACAEPSPEEQLSEAAKSLGAARVETSKAQKSLSEQEAEYEKARAALEVKRAEMRTQQAAKQAAEDLVAQRATDTALFRRVQGKLLEAPFEDTAIQVEVDKKVIRLTGIVDNAELKTEALKIAKQAPGHIRVIDEIRLSPAAKAKLAAETKPTK